MSRTVVLLSVLILAVVGALFGYVLGLRDIDENKSLAGDDPSAVSTGVTSAAANPPKRPTQNCPDFISDGVKLQQPDAGTPLVQLQYVRTDDSKKEAWICQARNGSELWYQGHDRIKDWADNGEVPEEGRNGLLLRGVAKTGDRKWVVTNQGTTYTVTPKALSIDGRTYGLSQANPPA
ncbi:hypothetical protein [Dactylosporangium sp. NPDC051541]|uniref:hypothetical protein n=1 Tax=Dactylosporangium sp. NPDC051541 TaxID=3363977 RepID=UPI0037904C67